MVQLSESREIEHYERARMKREAFILRVRDCYTYSDIAASMGVSAPTIKTWVQEMSVIMMPEDELEEARSMNVFRIDTDEAQATAMINRLAKLADDLQLREVDVMHIVREIRLWQE